MTIGNAGCGPDLNTLRLRQNGHHFADDTFKCIFFYENVRIAMKISLKFVPKGPINNIPSLVQIMARHRPGNKPLSEPMMVRLLMHICVKLKNMVPSPRPPGEFRGKKGFLKRLISLKKKG